MAIEVTVRDTESGETETKTIENDYIVVTAGNRHLVHVTEHAGGTTLLSIATLRGDE